MASHLRFLQLSDLHAGAPSSSELPADRRAARDEELASLPRRIAEIARAESVDVVLAPGNLCDVAVRDDAGARSLIEAFAALDPTPVVIAPGLDDPATSVGPYAAAWRALQHLPPWPPNVHVFAAAPPSTFVLPRRNDVSVTGLAHVAPRAHASRPLTQPLPRPATPLSLLVLHGSLLDAPVPAGDEPTFAFTERDLIAQGFTYAALGGRRTETEIRAGTGRLRGAYAGAAALRTLADAGQGAALLGTINEDVVNVERRALDPRPSHRLVVIVDATLHADGVWTRVREALERVPDPESIVAVQLVGSLAPGTALTRPADLTREALAARYFWADLDLRSSTSWAAATADRDRTRPPSLEQRFAQAIAARASDSPPRDAADDALHYGLLALRGQAISSRTET